MVEVQPSAHHRSNMQGAPQQAQQGAGGSAQAQAQAQAARAPQLPALDEPYGGLDLSVVRQHASDEIVKILDTVKGPKCLVLDPSLPKPLGLIIEVSLLKEKDAAVQKLDENSLETDCQNVFYVVRPQVQLMRQIADQIKMNIERGVKDKNYHLFFVPRKTLVCERELEQLGVLGDITLGEYGMDLIPFEDDCISLEIDEAFRETFLDGDWTSLNSVARSVMKLQAIYGLIPTVKSIGEGSKVVGALLDRMRKEIPDNDPMHTSHPEIDQLILIDRSVDMITPLLTQLTYEGLIDELFGIETNLVQLDEELTGSSDPRKWKHAVNNRDPIFAHARKMNFAEVGPFLNKRAKEIGSQEKERHNDMSVQQLGRFVKALGSINSEKQALSIHINLLTRLNDATSGRAFSTRRMYEMSLVVDGSTSTDLIEECINKQEPLVKVLRLCCLYSLVHNGLKQKMFDFLRKEILHSYGFQNIFTLLNLERVGLFKLAGSGRNPWPNVRKAYNLVVEEGQESAMMGQDDISHTYSGYAPLSIRLAHMVANNPMQGPVRDRIGLLQQPCDEYSQRPSAASGNAPKVVMLYFVGGLTYSELAAIRHLNDKAVAEGPGGVRYVACTTKMINGDTFLDGMLEVIENNLTEF